MTNFCENDSFRSIEYTDKLLNRLNRIEGQIRGLKKMVGNGSYCIDILTQSSAASAAINAFNKELLSQHIKTCVVNDIKKEHYEVVEELLKVIQKLMK
ncbi:MAG: metal-sensing transcriptional repressor [bacterium]|nr:metal-sensing transcriptional repressor [bacterium]